MNKCYIVNSLIYKWILGVKWIFKIIKLNVCNVIVFLYIKKFLDIK